ncbi:hypothetical protein GLOIN_2v1591899, partial [Rhizophagus irregularis DAOM 181602=DAOM 197198]
MISYCGFRAQQIHMFLIMLCFYFYIICKNMVNIISPNLSFIITNLVYQYY